MKRIKIILFFGALMASAITTMSQELTKDVKPFSRIIVSNHINLILEEGDQESVRIVHGEFDKRNINVEVRGKTLHLYLTDAKVTDRMERGYKHNRRSIYEGVSITAYVTYKSLELLQVRGSQEVSCYSPIHADKKFKLKAYGENEITFASIRTHYFKSVLYGQNKLKIKGGKSDFQRYKLYGENRIDASGMKSYSASATSFGESNLNVYSQDEMRVTSFGESRFSFSGDAYVTKGIIIGRTDISRN